jgi:Omp85 superfamily domain
MKALLLGIVCLAMLIAAPDVNAATPISGRGCGAKQVAVHKANGTAICFEVDSTPHGNGGSSTSEITLSAIQSGQNTSSLPTTISKAQRDESKKKKSAHRGSIVAAPLPIVSPAIGTGIIPVLGYIFPLGKDDKISSPSVIGAAGLITDNGSRGFGLGADLYMKEDTYEVTSIYAHGNVNYNLYGVGIAAGDAGLKLPLEQSGQVFFGEVLRRLKWKFFIGPRFWTGDSLVTPRPTTKETPPPPPDLGLHTTLRALGARLNRDTRPNRFYPTTGMLFDFTSDFFAKSLGSKYSFQSYRFTFNKYGTVGKNQVLAYNFFDCSTGGDPPFYGNCIYGTNNELRGYEAGRYLDRYMFATQLEYRLSLPKKFGLAAFGGIGEVVPGGKEFFRIDNFLPSVGGGPRFELSKKYHVNLRADFARGKGSWTWSMGVGEAF